MRRRDQVLWSLAIILVLLLVARVALPHVVRDWVNGKLMALENYDGVGQFRTMDSGVPIDPSGTLADGTAFTNPQELAQIIA